MHRGLSRLVGLIPLLGAAALPAQADTALLALALQHQQAGALEEALFWYHAGRLRWRTLAGLLDTSHPALAAQQAEQVRREAQLQALLLPALRCSPATLLRARQQALQWVRDHPAPATLYYQLAARPALAQANLAQGLAQVVAEEAAATGAAPAEPPAQCSGAPVLD